MRWHLCTALVVMLVIPGLAVAADAPGSADYPGIGRYEGSEIIKHRVEDYGETFFATGPVQSKKDAETTTLRMEGRITRIVYRVPPGVSALEVFRNFQARIEEAGYKEIFAGGPDQVDSYDLRYNHPAEVLEVISMSDKVYYLAARKQSDGAETVLSLLVSPHSGGDGQRVRLIAAESKQMEARMVDAEAMHRALSESGRIALYGIYFDTDSAEIKSESEPTLAEIAELMSGQPNLTVIVVGHTDTQGGFDYNMDLSSRRAAAVKQTLIEHYGVAPGRLKSAGVGYLAPAATNETDEGRAMNRRVELVRES